MVAAFYKLQIAKGYKAKTAFCTRFGLYEWKVCPFGLSGAPAAFQRYINGVLRKHLDDFVTAYVDDVLIYSSGSLQDHWSKIQKVLQLLGKAGLHLDSKKCIFATKKVKYLGFIMKAGKGIMYNLEKQRVIRDWEAPTTIKEV